jgi:hypothetical protein
MDVPTGSISAMLHHDRFQSASRLILSLPDEER